MRQIRLGVRQAIRSWKTTLLFSGLVLIGSYGLVAGAAGALEAKRFLDLNARLEDRDALYLRAEYLRTPTLAPDLVTRWTLLLADDKGYAVVLHNHEIVSVTGHDVVVATGAFAGAYGFPESEGNGPTAFLGAHVSGTEVGEVIDLGPYRARVAGRLDRGAGLLDPWSGFVDMSDKILLTIPVEQVGALDWPALSEALTRTVFLGVEEPPLDQLVDAAFASGIQLIPYRSTDPDAVGWSRFLRESTIILTMYGLFFVVIAVGVGSVVLTLVRAGRRRLAIERLCGATLAHLSLGQATYASVVLVLPATLVVGLLSLVFPPVRSAAPLVIVLALAVVAVLTARAMVELASGDLASHVRGAG